MLVPQEALNRLTCSFCNNYLSIFPIHYEDEQKTYTCGRCPLITSPSQVRQVAYEDLAKFMKFPCKYEENGCVENCVPYDLMKHEDSCKYRPYFCPILPLGDCAWQGRYDELYEHFLDDHKRYVLSSLQLEVDLINNYEEHYMFLHESKPFIAYLKCNVNRDEFYCCVKGLSPAEDEQPYKYEISLCNNQGKNYDFDPRPVQTNANNAIDRAKATCIDICNIKLKLQDPNYVLLKIKVFKPENSGSNFTSLSKMEEDMLRNIECPVCLDYMTPPILQCNTGHSICEKCTIGRLECPMCRGAIGNTRNFSLEEFTLFIRYPCKYREFGCTYTGNSSNIREHETECKSGPFTCPIDGCKWKNNISGLFQHIKISHEDNLLDLDNVDFCFDPGNDEDATFIINTYGNFFKLYFCYRNDVFFWAMQTIGAVEINSKYMFELDIKSNISSERIFARKNCSSLTKNDEALNDGQSYIEFSENVLRDMIQEDILQYSFRIIKENT